MPEQPLFIELEDTDSGQLPPAPIDSHEVKSPSDNVPSAEKRYGHLLSHGTTVSEKWTESWIEKVIEVEKEQGYAICGAKKRAEDLLESDDTLTDPLAMVCRNRAGYRTDHPGEGRCTHHGGHLHLGTTKTGQFSLLKNNKLSGRVHEFFENEQILDMRSVIGTTWAAADAMLEDEEEISPDRAAQIGALMTRIANMVKQHNDIQEKRRISIEVPEFMAWSEFFYELAVEHIERSGGDVAAFLRDAQSFYDRTVTIVVGAQGSRNRLGAGDQIGAESDAGVSRPVVEIP